MGHPLGSIVQKDIMESTMIFTWELAAEDEIPFLREMFAAAQKLNNMADDEDRARFRFVDP